VVEELGLVEPAEERLDRIVVIMFLGDYKIKALCE